MAKLQWQHRLEIPIATSHKCEGVLVLGQLLRNECLETLPDVRKRRGGAHSLLLSV